VCVAPVSTIVDARRDPLYREVVNKAALVTPDGMPVAWLGKRRVGAQVARTYGPDLMLKACDEGVAYGFRHFFYGATADVCDKLERSLREKSPNLVVCGKIAPPFMRKAEVLSPDIIDIINKAKPDILWVGLGSPKQDFWMAKNRAVLDVSVMVGIGAAFDFHAGVKPQAPRWMQRSGLEWMFRLWCEPGRLWKRYLVGNTLFVFWLVQEKVGKLFHS
jgi:N-acetylglucosaminyldiphosphoundecaprenol N-acetyl-beta-D-mannosaminyltransferase